MSAIWHLQMEPKKTVFLRCIITVFPSRRAAFDFLMRGSCLRVDACMFCISLIIIIIIDVLHHKKVNCRISYFMYIYIYINTYIDNGVAVKYGEYE